MGQLCLALAPKHPKVTFFRPSSQTPLPTPDTLRHAIASDYTPPIPLATAALLKGVRIEYAWKGNVAFTFDLLPHLGRHHNGMHYAMGFCGHGVAMASYLGA